ncbi:hypothetical protein [Ensifer sp. LCM 4579]|uniref:hypothetical protein n=1 Tax=Ensifer sp. LCM 4579 TaxID=1848292 RepID=UPI0008D9003B|nr:hypothetical protein [Ensifer sp. LCM 4579]OHV81790.1 hypothetical protein LCM4579_18510 [Ensifer sp. LCM 4579]
MSKSDWFFSEFLAGQAGAVTGSIPNEMGRNSVARPTSVASSEDSGIGLVILVILGLVIASGYYVVSGYMVSSRIVSDYLGHASRGGEHDWRLIGVYAVCGLMGVAVVGRLLGLFAGILASAIPAIPLLHASEGGVGFWWIVDRTVAEPGENATAAGMAAAGIILIHLWVVWMVRWREEAFSHQIIRWKWIQCRVGIVMTAGLLLLGYGASEFLKAASARF